MKPIYEDFSHVISPITGKIRFEGVQDLTEDYVWIGDANNNSFPSPVIIDIRLDIVELRTILDKLVPSTFILQTKNDILPNSQALDELTTGFLYNTNGLVSIQTPGSGNLSLQENYVYLGDSNNIAQGQPTINFSNLPDLSNKQIIIGNSLDRPEARTTFYYDNFPDLQNKKLIIGDSSNRPIETLTIFIDNLPNLTNQRIWRGNSFNRPEESDALTNAESSISQTLQDLANLASVVSAISNAVNALTSTVDALETGLAAIGGFGAILILQAEVFGLIGAVAGLSSRVSDLEDDVTVIQGQITDIYNQLTSINNQITTINNQITIINGEIININNEISLINSELIAINARIDNLRLNTIPADGDVSFYNFKLINLADAVDPQDGVNLRTMEAAIGGAIDNISLDGFVLGDSDENGLIHTTRGSLCLLTNIPAGGDVSLDNFRITNLGDYEADNDALSIQGFWDLIHNPDLYVARINPELAIIGNVQQFSFNQNRSVFQIENTFTPTNLIPSENIEEFRNSNNSGYRLVQETAATSNSGDFYLEKFLNGEEDGEKIISFKESSDELTLEKILNANNQRIVNVTEEPAGDQDAISFIYLWRVLNDEVF